MKIKRIKTDRNPDHPDYQMTVEVVVEGGVEGRWLRYTEDTQGRYLTQIMERDGVVDDMADGVFDYPLDEFALESIAVLSAAMDDGRLEGWTLTMLSGERGPSPTNVEYSA